MNNEVHLAGPSPYRNRITMFCNFVAILILTLPFYFIYDQVTDSFAIRNEKKIESKDPRWIFIKKGPFNIDRLKIWYEAKTEYHDYISIGVLMSSLVALIIYRLGLLSFNIYYLKIDSGEVYKLVRRFDKVIKKKLIGNLSNYDHIYLGTKVFYGGTSSTREALVLELRGKSVDRIHEFYDLKMLSAVKVIAEKISKITQFPLRNDLEYKS